MGFVYLLYFELFLIFSQISLCIDYLLYIFSVLAEDAIKAALHDYKVKNEGPPSPSDGDAKAAAAN